MHHVPAMWPLGLLCRVCPCPPEVPYLPQHHQGQGPGLHVLMVGKFSAPGRVTMKEEDEGGKLMIVVKVVYS